MKVKTKIKSGLLISNAPGGVGNGPGNGNTPACLYGCPPPKPIEPPC